MRIGVSVVAISILGVFTPGCCGTPQNLVFERDVLGNVTWGYELACETFGNVRICTDRTFRGDLLTGETCAFSGEHGEYTEVIVYHYSAGELDGITVTLTGGILGDESRVIDFGEVPGGTEDQVKPLTLETGLPQVLSMAQDLCDCQEGKPREGDLRTVHRIQENR